jgi:hypothetical protein
MPENEKIGYMVHDDAIRLERKAKDRYTVWYFWSVASFSSPQGQTYGGLLLLKHVLEI